MEIDDTKLDALLKEMGSRIGKETALKLEAEGFFAPVPLLRLRGELQPDGTVLVQDAGELLSFFREKINLLIDELLGTVIEEFGDVLVQARVKDSEK